MTYPNTLHTVAMALWLITFVSSIAYANDVILVASLLLLLAIKRLEA